MFKRNSPVRTGICLALATAVISGISIYVSKFATQVVPDPFLLTTLRNTLVGVCLLASLFFVRQEVSSIEFKGRDWLALVGLAVVGGSLPFLLFFKGLADASAPSAALIQKTLVIWVAVLAMPLLNERVGMWTVAGLGLLALGQVLGGWPKAWGWGSGENLVLIATLLWSVETIIAKRVLQKVPTVLGATARMAGGAVVMWLYLLVVGKAGSVLTLNATQWIWVILPSFLLLGYVTTWYAALKRAPATVVTSVLALGAPITAALALAFEGKMVEVVPLAGLALIVVGVAFTLGTKVGVRQDVQPALT